MEMEKIIYNKVVRDKIPDIIQKSGKVCKTKTLTNSEFLLKLEEKLQEELNEYYASKDIMELADLLVVVLKILELKNTSWVEFTTQREEKKLQ